MTVSLGRLLAVSPHLDDAVLSAGSLFGAHPESVVVTVFAGFPADSAGLTEWDAACGFAEGDNVVALRRAEDARALARLNATPRWLDFVDDQYEIERPAVRDVAAAIATTVREAGVDALALPLGIWHRDHDRTHDACIWLLENDPDLVEHWVAWADVPYRAGYPELVGERLVSLRARGFRLNEWSLGVDERKRAAVAEYASQLRALGAGTFDEVDRAEQFFTLRRQ